MARISEEDIARIRDATDLVGLISERTPLKRKGRLYWACCPLHQEKTPSFKVDPATGLWHCFGCGAGGDAFGYLMQTDNLTFLEAVTLLADRAHIEIETTADDTIKRGLREKIYAICDDTARYYHAVLTRSPTSEPTQARTYLSARGFGSELASSWTLGYAAGGGMLVSYLREQGHQDDDMLAANVALRTGDGLLRDRFYHRIMFPIKDIRGRVCAFGGRILGEGQPKYLNTNDTPIFKKSNTLYGLDVAKNPIVKTKTALVVEGYTDVIALHEAGYDNAVATLGTALTEQHVKLLARFAQRVIYVFDGDEAGLRAADRAVEFIDETITPEATKNPIMLDVLILPAGSDPADMVSTETGLREFNELLEQTTPLITYALERRLAPYDLSRPEQQVRALDDAVSILAPIKTSSIAASYARDLADHFAAAGSSIDLNQVLSALSRTKVVARRNDEDAAQDKAPGLSEDDQAEAYDPLEVETIGLMIANPTMRKAISQIIDVDMLNAELMRVLFTTITSKDHMKTTPEELLSELIRLRPEVSSVFSGYDFVEGQHVHPDTGVEFARSIKIGQMERRIRLLRAQLRRVEDKEGKQRLVEEIVSLQKQLLETS
ncbi:MAG: DNA primase [Actinomycetia bacterium]|nr:DNA primase [Actinomycetes bacterium]